MRQYNKVYLEITNRCNLRCSFCPGTRRPPRTMSPAEFRLLAEKLRPATRYLYLHLMGEPLLPPELPALLAIAGELDFLVNITTNGTLLPRRERPCWPLLPSARSVFPCTAWRPMTAGSFPPTWRVAFPLPKGLPPRAN